MDLTTKIKSAIETRKIIVDKWHFEDAEYLNQLYEINLTIEEAQDIQDELDRLRRSVVGLEMQVQSLAEQCGYRERTKRDG